MKGVKIDARFDRALSPANSAIAILAELGPKLPFKKPLPHGVFIRLAQGFNAATPASCALSPLQALKTCAKCRHKAWSHAFKLS